MPRQSRLPALLHRISTLIAALVLASCGGGSAPTSTRVTEDGLTYTCNSSELLHVGDSRAINCRFISKDGKDTTKIVCGCVSADASVATTDFTTFQGGTFWIVGLKPGRTTITITASTGKVFTVDVTVAPFLLFIDPNPKSAQVGEVLDYKFIVKDAGLNNRDYNHALTTWSISPTSVARINSTSGALRLDGPSGPSNDAGPPQTAKIQAMGVGSATITVEYSGPGGGFATATLNVTAPPQPPQTGIIATGSPGIRLATVSTPTNTKQYRLYSLLDKRLFPSVPLADALFSSTEGVVPLHVSPARLVTTFTSSNTGAATITSGGLATSVAAGTTTISAQWTDNGRDYEASLTETVGIADDASTASVSLTFAQGAPTTIRVGEATVLRCQARSASGANIPVHNTAWSVSFTFSGPPGSTPPPPPITVDQFGVVTAQGTGTATANCFVNGVAGTAISFTVTP